MPAMRILSADVVDVREAEVAEASLDAHHRGRWAAGVEAVEGERCGPQGMVVGVDEPDGRRAIGLEAAQALVVVKQSLGSARQMAV